MRIPTGADQIEIVESVVPERGYHCPDLTTLDRHLASLVCQMHLGWHGTPEWKHAMRKDVDRLLDRRLFLTLPTGPERASS